MHLLVESLQKPFRKYVDIEQIIVTFRFKIKSLDHFHNKYGIKLNKVL